MSAHLLKAKQEADTRGHVIVSPGPRELFVDIDTPESEGRFNRGLQFLAKIVEKTELRPSPSGKDGRKHGYVTINRDVRDEYERVLLQCLLGSDLTHEGCSWSELNAGHTNVTIFFEKPVDPAPNNATDGLGETKTKGRERFPLHDSAVPPY
jgi:hypothetical protein